MSEFDDFKEYVSKVYPRDTAIKENYPLEELIEMYRDLYDKFLRKNKMTQSFDEWVDKNSLNFHPTDYYLYKDIFEAGAQSKQAEIDEYKEVAESMEDSYLREKAKVDELRKRVDEIGTLLSTWNSELDEMSKYGDSGAHCFSVCIDELSEILKGTTDEQ